MSSCAARELRLLPGALAAARLHAAAPQPGSGDPALQASGEQQQESVQSAQARAMPPAPTQRTLRPRVRPACEPLAALQAASSEDSDVYTDVPSASPPARRTRGNATRPRNRCETSTALAPRRPAPAQGRGWGSPD